MKRKTWVILSLVLVLSIAFNGFASAANPVVDTFLGGRVDLNSAISYTTGYGTLKYNNSGHPGTTYTNYIKITYTYTNKIFPFPSDTYTKTKSASVQNGNASVSYPAPGGYRSLSVSSLGNVNQLGEIWVGTTDVIHYD